MAMSAPPRFFIAFFVASRAGRCSSCMMRSTFSTTTIAWRRPPRCRWPESIPAASAYSARTRKASSRRRCRSEDRHGHNGNDRCAPALQREVNDQNHQQQGLEQRAVNADRDRLRGIYAVRCRKRDVVGDALGDLRRSLPSSPGPDSATCMAFCARQHVDVQYGGVPACSHAALGIVWTRLRARYALRRATLDASSRPDSPGLRSPTRTDRPTKDGLER